MRKILILLLVLTMIFCFVGCKQKVPAGPQIDDESTPTTVVEGEESPPTKIWDNRNTFSVDINDKYLWEKEFEQLNQNEIAFDENWEEYITISGNKILSTGTDLSFVDNYFLNGDFSSADLEALYLVELSSQELDTGKVQIDQFADIRMTLQCKNYNKNAIVEKIRVVSTLNPYEYTIEEFGNNYNSVDGQFGIGSNHKYVLDILGKPDDKNIGNADDEYELIQYHYFGEDTDLMLAFMVKKDDVDNGVLVTFEWTPKTLRSMLISDVSKTSDQEIANIE